MVKKSKKLPPHSWEAHPLAHRGEANKQLIIALITIFAIVVLVVFLFLGKMFVGKAIYIGEVNSLWLGLESDSSVIENNEFTMKVMSNIGTEKTVAVQFDVTFPSGITCDQITIIPSLGWTNLVDDTLNREVDAEGKAHYYFIQSTLDHTLFKTGVFEIADISLELPKGNYEFQINGRVWSMSETPVDKITSTKFLTVNVASASAPTEDICSPTSLEFCINGLDCENNEGIWDKDTNTCSSPVEEPADVETKCSNNFDDDEDNFVDCEDPDCSPDQACIAPPITCQTDADCAEGEFCNDNDECAIPTKSEIGVCDNHLDDDNDGFEDCDDKDCTSDKSCQVLTPTVETVTITLSDVATDLEISTTEKISASSSYRITADIIPSEDLPENHLAIITVNYGSEQTTKFIVSKNALKAGQMESLEFVETIPADKVGGLTINVLVWKNWPSTNEEFQSLLFAKQDYTVVSPN